MRRRFFNLVLGRIFSLKKGGITLKKYLLSSLTAIFLGFVTTSAVAELKIGVVSVSDVMQKYPQREQVIAKLKQEFEKRNQEVLKLKKDLERLQNRLDRDSSVITPNEAQEIQKEVIEKRRTLRNLEEAFQEDAARREQEEAQKLLEKIGKIVDNIAKAEKYDLIIRREAAPFYVSDRVDVTQKVLSKLGEQPVSARK